MSDLAAAVEDYLAIRRSVGFTLDRAGKLLPDFVAYLDATGAQTVAVAAAAEWAMKPAAATPAWWAQRLAIVRGFARYLHAIDESNEIPPTDLLPGHKRRLAPYLYSDADIAALMSAAGQLVPAWRAACYQTLIGLLAVTGLRLGEASASTATMSTCRKGGCSSATANAAGGVRSRCTRARSRRYRATAGSAISSGRSR